MRRFGRVFPRPLTFGTPGEAEEEEFFYSAYISDALEAAAATGMRYGYGGGEESDWFDRACWDGVAVALEQCCDQAVVLPAQLRESRLKPFSLQQRAAAERFLWEIPPKIGKRVLPFIFWAVRIERAKRTGSPEFNPKRPLQVDEFEE
jgi:hypothetical protein